MDWKKEIRAGIFVVIEGIDACGKETQAKILHQKFKERVNPHAELLDFPDYNGEYGQLIRGHLRREWRAERTGAVADPNKEHEIRELLNAKVFQALHTADKMSAAPRILSAMTVGRPIVANRYWQSAYSYGKGDGLDGQWLMAQNAFLPRADLNVLLDVQVEDSFNRRPERRDRNEDRREYLVQVLKIYRDLWEFMHRLPGGDPHQWVSVNARGSVEETALLIEEQIEHLIGYLNAGRRK